MQLKDVKTLSKIAEQYDIPVETLRSRLKKLEEGNDYLKLEGSKQPILLSPCGVAKITKGVKKDD